MSEAFSLGARLGACADFVRNDCAFADIGTDHGYLPVWLLMQGRVSSAIAADIGEGPLSSAKRTADKYRITLKTVLSDGFLELEPCEVDDAAIAGMGGELIADIISKAQWLKNSSKHLILQPMSKPDKLRRFLFSNGFDIISEKALMDEGKIYSVMLAAYSDKPVLHDNIDIYMGKIFPESEFSMEYAEKVIRLLKNKLKGYIHNEDFEAERDCSDLISQIQHTYIEPFSGKESE